MMAPRIMLFPVSSLSMTDRILISMTFLEQIPGQQSPSDSEICFPSGLFYFLDAYIHLNMEFDIIWFRHGYGQMGWYFGRSGNFDPLIYTGLPLPENQSEINASAYY